MKKIQQIEAKNQVLEKANSDNQNKVTSLEAKVNNIENMIKKMVDNNSKSLQTMVDNVSSHLKNLEQDKGQDSPTMVDNQGPSKRTWAHSKKNEEMNKMEEVKGTIENMHILVDQAANSIKTIQLF